VVVIVEVVAVVVEVIVVVVVTVVEEVEITVVVVSAVNGVAVTGIDVVVAVVSKVVVVTGSIVVVVVELDVGLVRGRHWAPLNSWISQKSEHSSSPLDVFSLKILFNSSSVLNHLSENFLRQGYPLWNASLEHHSCNTTKTLEKLHLTLSPQTSSYHIHRLGLQEQRKL
jgi:hypothetical protein